MIKTILALGLAGVALTTSAQSTDQQQITHVIKAFARAGDEQNADELEKYLDSNHRLILNQLFGSKEVAIMPREVYLEKIRTKVFGGDTREVTIDELTVFQTAATAKVTMKGKKSTVVALMQLIRNAAGEWKIVSDIPVML